jgi:hypothetical protein
METKSRSEPDKICEFCGEKFRPRALNQRFCNEFCREKRVKVEYDRPCLWCGRSVNSTNPKTKFCSSTCRALASKSQVCFYCGQPGGKLDKVEDNVIRCCIECKVILDSDTRFKTFKSRREFLKRTYLQKNKKVLERPDWTEEEIAEIGYGLQSSVRRFQAEKNILKERLVILSSPLPEIVRNARNEIDYIVDEMMAEIEADA